MSGLLPLRKLAAGVDAFAPTMLPASPSRHPTLGTARPPGLAAAAGAAATRLPPPPRLPGRDVMKGVPLLKPLRGLGEMLKHACVELSKLGAISPDQARRSLDRLDSLETSKPTAGQVARYGVLGAGAGALSKGVSSAIEHGHVAGSRALLGAGAAGAIGMGAVPLIRGALDRHAEKNTLKKFVAQPEAGLVKSALIERLVRLGATDVPGTPRLLMKQRSPQELAQLQQGVQGAMDRFKAPLKAKVEAGAQKLPGLLQKPARMLGHSLIDHPETALLHAAPVPLLTPAWIAAKKGLERGIDRFAPAAKLSFATNAFSGPMNPTILSGASSQPGFRAPSLKHAIQKTAENYPKGTVARVEGDALVIKKPDGSKIVKTSSGAPTRGNFMMASDVPAFKQPRLDRAIQKDSALLPDNVTYDAGDFKRSKYSMDRVTISAFVDALFKTAGPNTPATQLAQTQSVGAPKATAPPGPSIADIAKPRGARFGTGIPGAFKTGIGGMAPVSMK